MNIVKSIKKRPASIGHIISQCINKIAPETKKRAKEAKENELKTEKHTQAYKKYQLAGQDNANLITKDLDFASNESFRTATSGVIDRLAKAKADYEFATEPKEIERLLHE